MGLLMATELVEGIAFSPPQNPRYVNLRYASGGPFPHGKSRRPSIPHIYTRLCSAPTGTRTQTSRMKTLCTNLSTMAPYIRVVTKMLQLCILVIITLRFLKVTLSQLIKSLNLSVLNYLSNLSNIHICIEELNIITPSSSNHRRMILFHQSYYLQRCIL